ncbi:MAG TPA: TonB-dependent receptor [Candidatus Acidoferrales bacterium]|nr:TonB-dependent receptor [Candidatus Acidoferrales bacterium]
MRVRIGVVVLALAALVGVSARAQVGTSSITGVVADASGARIPGATVTAINEATNATNRSATSAAGTFAFPSLPAGSYTITVESQGFERFVAQHNVLSVGSPLVLNAALKVGAVSQTVQVEGTYERLQTTNATLSDVVTGMALRNLPLNGRNPLNLIVFEPGLVQQSNGAAGSDTHVNGSRDRAFNVTLDGIDINEPSVPNPQSNVFGVNSDNIAEYRIITQDPTPQFGRNSGANIVLTTRGGTNDLHGDLHESFRNPVLDANDWFSNALGSPRAALKLNQYGAQVGGPILKNKLFFFGSWQGARFSNSESIADAFGIPGVYTASARQGLFRYVVGTVNGTSHNTAALVDGQGNLLPGINQCSATITTNCIATYNIPGNDPAHIGLDKTMSAFADAEPLPNSFTARGDALNTAGFVWNPTQTQPEADWLGRVDYTIGPNDSAFARYLISFRDTLGGDFLNGRPVLFPGFPPLGGVKRRPSGLAVGYRHVFSPQVVNEFTMGYGRFLFNFLFALANPNFPNIPPFNTSNISSPFNTAGSQTARTLTTIQYVDNLSINHGSHFFSLGTNIRFLQHNDVRSFVGGVIAAPNVNFSGSARPPENLGFAFPGNISSTDSGTLAQAIDELVGLPSSVTQAYFADGLSAFDPNGNYVRGPRIHQYDFYAQDQWKAKSNLTVTYGLRYEYNAPGTEARNLILGPNGAPDQFSTNGPLTFVPKSSFWSRSNAIGLLPRIGVAWDPTGKGKMVIRSGFGMAFDTISTFQLVPILGLVPGTSAACAVSISDSSGVTTAKSSSSFCTIPAGVTSRVAGGFPLSLPQPTAAPSTFTSPAAQGFRTAPPAGGVDPNLKNPAVYQWDVDIQRSIGHDTVLDVAYVGNRGTHLLRAYDLNQDIINHDGYLQSFAIARQNFIQCGNPNGTAGCGQAPGILSSLFGGKISTVSTVTTDLLFNAAGALANFIDSNDFNSMVAATGRPNFFRPNPQFSSFFWLDTGGDSSYNALQIHLRRHEANADFGAAYTYAKSIDDMSVDPVGATSGGGLSSTNSHTPTDIYNFTADRGRSAFDRTQVLAGYFVWNLPFGHGQRFGSHVSSWANEVIGGWTGTSIVSASSGEPFSVLSGELSNSNTHVSYADVIGPVPNASLVFGAPRVTGPEMFNVGSLITNKTDPHVGCVPVNGGQSFFCVPPPGSDGGLGRDIFNGPNFWNVDIGLAKRFPITERVGLQFRTDFFNAFNHQNFDNPVGASSGSPRIISSVFGQSCCSAVSVPSDSSVLATGEPYRVVQFALRLSF